MEYDRYEEHSDKRQYQYISINKILRNIFNMNFKHKGITSEEFEKLLPYLSTTAKNFLKEKRIANEASNGRTIAYKSEGTSEFYIIVDKSMTSEDIEKFLQESEFNEWLSTAISNYGNSKGKKLEDYDLIEEAIIALKSAGYKVPTKIYENPDQLLKQLDRICFGKQYLMREIINKLKLENIFKEDNITDNSWKLSNVKKVPVSDPNGSQVVKDYSTGAFVAIEVSGKIGINQNGKTYAPTLFSIDSKGNIYTETEFMTQQSELIEEAHSRYRKIEEKIFRLKFDSEKKIDTMLFAPGLSAAFFSFPILAINLCTNSFLITLCLMIMAIALPIVPNLIQLINIKKELKEEQQALKDMTYIPKVNTRYIAEMIERIYEENPTYEDIADVVKGLNPEIGKMIIEGQTFENIKLLEAPKTAHIEEAPQILPQEIRPTLLSVDQTKIISEPGEEDIDNRTDIIKKTGLTCPITDFAIALGGDVYDIWYDENEKLITPESELIELEFYSEYPIDAWHLETPRWRRVEKEAALKRWVYSSRHCYCKKERSGDWYLSSIKDQQTIYLINMCGQLRTVRQNDCSIAIRPVLEYPNIQELFPQSTMREDGILEITYGEYPQDVVPPRLREFLEEAYQENKLCKTGKTYTINSADDENNSEQSFQQTLEEYTFKNEKYVRVKVKKSNSERAELSDGTTVHPGDYIWIKVSPITWYIDEELQLLVSKSLLVAGIRFYNPCDIAELENFENTEMSMFLKNTFLKDIIPSKVPDIQTKETEAYEQQIQKLIAARRQIQEEIIRQNNEEKSKEPYSQSLQKTLENIWRR
ncbi:MAG: hypothetical protein IKD77_04895 [Bacilli bacterium]|nr:hypothetical protein [Bacilli bacterium]